MRNTKLVFFDEEALDGIFYRAWTEEIRGFRPNREATPSELKRWMDAGERKIVAAIKRFREKQMVGERQTHQRYKEQTRKTRKTP